MSEKEYKQALVGVKKTIQPDHDCGFSQTPFSREKILEMYETGKCARDIRNKELTCDFCRECEQVSRFHCYVFDARAINSNKELFDKAKILFKKKE